MDQEADQELNVSETLEEQAAPRPRTSRRQILQYGALGLAGLSAAGLATYSALRRTYSALSRPSAALPGTDAEEAATAGGAAGPVGSAEVFKNDAPSGPLWESWKQRGWVKEARHYLKLGRNVECKLCPNDCLLEPEDRSHCRNKVNKDGTLYTMAYGNPCTFHMDPIEKKPLFHFLPGTDVFSIAVSGCGFRCLNCQNWDISQRRPEETKDSRGEEIRSQPRRRHALTQRDMNRLSMFPEDVLAMTDWFDCPSIAYTYSEPTAWYEYMIDTAKAARAKSVKNVWVTCGYIEEEPLLELCKYLDAANVDLKSFSEEIYQKLNSGKLEPILRTLKILKQQGVWFEVTNLVVPTYTDKPDMIRRMCDWLLKNLGPDYPLHFSRFHPQHKLAHLPPTPIETLTRARDIARSAGLHHVYIGNVRGVQDAETTFCPNCQNTVIERIAYFVRAMNVKGGKCKNCGTKIAGVWG